MTSNVPLEKIYTGRCTASQSAHPNHAFLKLRPLSRNYIDLRTS